MSQFSVSSQKRAIRCKGQENKYINKNINKGALYCIGWNFFENLFKMGICKNKFEKPWYSCR